MKRVASKNKAKCFNKENTKMPTAETIKSQRTVFDLNTMEEVTLLKEGTFTPVETAAEALSRLNNDNAKLLSVINDGLITAARRELSKDASLPWQKVNEDGSIGDLGEIVPADQKAVNGLVLNLAKSVFGFNKDMSKEEKRSAKESAIDFIKSSDKIKAGLIKNAAAESESE